MGSLSKCITKTYRQWKRGVLKVIMFNFNFTDGGQNELPFPK